MESHYGLKNRQFWKQGKSRVFHETIAKMANSSGRIVSRLNSRHISLRIENDMKPQAGIKLKGSQWQNVSHPQFNRMAGAC